MSVKVKTAFVMFLTLVIGMVLGAMINRALLEKRIRRAVSFREPTMFVQSLMERIAPDPDQRKKIENILRKYGQKNAEIRSKSREEMEEAFQSLRSELEPLLTPQQLERLNERLPGRPGRGMAPLVLDPERELEMLTDQLSLTDEQIDQIGTILRRFQEDIRGTIPRAGKPTPGFNPFREAQSRKNEAIRQILSEEQRKIFDRMNREPPFRRNGIRR